MLEACILNWAALPVQLCSSCHLNVLVLNALTVNTMLPMHCANAIGHTRTRSPCYCQRKAGITCWSLATLPRKTSTPSPRQQASSPVLYMRVCCSSPLLKGLGTKRSPVMTGWPLYPLAKQMPLMYNSPFSPTHDQNISFVGAGELCRQKQGTERVSPHQAWAAVRWCAVSRLDMLRTCLHASFLQLQ